MILCATGISITRHKYVNWPFVMSEMVSAICICIYKMLFATTLCFGYGYGYRSAVSPGCVSVCLSVLLTCCICALTRRSSCPQRHSISRPTCSGLRWTGIRGLLTCSSTGRKEEKRERILQIKIKRTHRALSQSENTQWHEASLFHALGGSGIQGLKRGVVRTSGGAGGWTGSSMKGSREEGYKPVLTFEGSVVGARQAERLRRAHCHDWWAHSSSQLPTAIRGSNTSPLLRGQRSYVCFKTASARSRSEASLSLSPFFCVKRSGASGKNRREASRHAGNSRLLAGGDAHGRTIHAGVWKKANG